MTGMEGDWRWLETMAHLGAALVFLLVGWRLGRESVGAPMFSYRALPQAMEEAVAEEADPWSAASLGGPAEGGAPVAVRLKIKASTASQRPSRGVSAPKSPLPLLHSPAPLLPPGLLPGPVPASATGNGCDAAIDEICCMIASCCAVSWGAAPAASALDTPSTRAAS